MNFSPIEWMNEYYLHSPIKVKFLLVSILVLFILCITVLLVLVSLRMKLYKRRNTSEILKAKYEEQLITLLYLDPEGPGFDHDRLELIQELKKAVSVKTERNILNGMLLNLHRNISGDISNQIRGLFHELGLMKYAVKKLNSRKWHVKIQGIRELTEMKEHSIQNYVTNLVNHENNLLRREAQLTMVRLFEYSGLSFLKDLHYPISEWQQLQLMAAIQQNVEFVIPKIDDLLKSKNITVVQFALRLIQVFNQTIEPEEMKRLISHEDPMIRQQTIDLIGELGLFDMKPFLKEQYIDLGKKEKLSVLNALTYLGTEEDLEFLLTRSEDQDFKISLQAMLALKELLSVDSFKAEVNALKVKNKKVLEYVMDQVC